MLIRNATYFDVPEILALAHKYVEEEVSVVGHHSDVWCVNSLSHHLMSSLSSDDGIVLIARVDGKLTGYLWATTHLMAPWSPLTVASDLLFYVKPECRGTTVALRLVKAYKEWAEELGCHEVRLSTASGINTERVGQFYERLGFSPFAQTYNYKPKEV